MKNLMMIFRFRICTFKNEMKINLISDIHLDTGYYHIEQNFTNYDVILFAGDMGKYFWKQLNSYKERRIKLFGCKGNHWWYGKDIRKEKTSPDEVEVLKKGDYVFLATTLWTNFDLYAGKSSSEGNLSGKNYDLNKHIEAIHSAMDNINDFKLIKNSYSGWKKPLITPFQMGCWHWTARKNLQEKLNKYKDKKCVVITHFAPSLKCIPEKYKGSSLNPYFANNMDDFIFNNPQIILWHYGHLHNSSDFMIGNCRCIENSRGYENSNGIENPNFNPNLTIDI